MKCFTALRCFILLALAAQAFAAPDASERPHDLASLFRTEDNLAIVRSPEHVELCILEVKKPLFDRENSKKWKYAEEAGRALGSDQARVLSAKLTDEKSYDFNALSKFCSPDYNARVKFTRGGHTVSIDFCFTCKIAAFTRDGVYFSRYDFDPFAEIAFEIVRAEFPDNRVIRDLLKQREREREAATQSEIAAELAQLNRTKSAPSPAK